jgi:hypothetical protein
MGGLMLSERITINGITHNFKDLFYILIDFIFKAIFSDREIAGLFLSALLGRKIIISEVNTNVRYAEPDYAKKEICH